MVQVSLYDISILQTAGPCLIYTEVIMLSGSLQLMRLRFAARFYVWEIIEYRSFGIDVRVLAEKVNISTDENKKEH